MSKDRYKQLIIGGLVAATSLCFSADFEVTNSGGDEAVSGTLPNIINENIYIEDGDRVLYSFPNVDDFATVLNQDLELDIDVSISTKDVTRDLFIDVSLSEGDYGSTINIQGSSCSMTGFNNVENDVVFSGGGTLTVNAVTEASPPTYQGDFSGNGDLNITGTGNSSFIGVLSQVDSYSGKSLTKAGLGTANLLGDSTFSGETTINEGTLVFAGPITGLPSDITIESGATLQVGTSLDEGQTFTGDISGAGSVVKTEESTTSFVGDLSYTGPTSILGGTLSIVSGVTMESDITIETGATLDFSPLSPESYGQTITGTISGGGSVTVNGSNTTELTGDLWYTGDTTVNSALTISGPITNLSSDITINDGGTLTIGNGAVQVFIGNIAGPGDFVFSGDSLTTLYGKFEVSGTTTLQNGGVLALSGYVSSDSDINIGQNSQLKLGSESLYPQFFGSPGSFSGAGELVKSGPVETEIYGDVSNFSGDITVLSGALSFLGSAENCSSDMYVVSGAFIDFGSDDYSQSFDGVIHGTGSVRKFNQGTTELSGNASYSGQTRIDAGQLTYTGAITNLQSDIIISENATLGFDSSSNQLFTGGVSGGGSISKSGTGRTMMTGYLSYTGDTIISEGTLVMNGGFSNLSSDISVAENSFLNIGTLGETQQFSGDISGAGGFNKSGESFTTFSGDVSLSGSSSITGGRLILTGAINDFGSDIAISSDANLISQSSSDQTLSGALTGAGAFTKKGTGTTTLSGNLGYTGPTYLNEGTLSLTGNITDLPCDFIIEEDKNATLVVGGSNAQVLSGNIILGSSSSVNLLKVSSGRTTFSGDFSNLGTTQISAGTLALVGTAREFGSVGISSGATFDLGVETDGVLKGVFGSGNFTKSGSGLTALSDTVTYTGDTTVSAGTLIFNRRDYTGDFQVSSGATLEVGNFETDTSANMVLSGALSGRGSLNKQGFGTVTLTGESTFSGPTAVNGGILAVNGVLDQSQITVNQLGELRGTGTVGAVTNSGAVAPGSSIGTLNVIGDYVQNSGAKLISEFNATETDLLQVSGTATLEEGSILVLVPEQNASYVHGSTHQFLTATGGINGQFSEIIIANNAALDSQQLSVQHFDGFVHLVLNPNYYINNMMDINSQLALKSSQAQFNNFRAVNERNLYAYDWCSGQTCAKKIDKTNQEQSGIEAQEDNQKACEEFPCKNQGFDFYVLSNYTAFDIKKADDRTPADTKTSATTVGLEYVFEDYGSVGLGVGYTYGQVKNPEITNTKTTLDAFTVGVTGLFAPMKYLTFDVAGSVDFAWYSMDRSTTNYLLNSNATAKPEGTNANAALRVNGRFCLFSVLFQPFYSTEYSWRRISGYTEQGPINSTYEVGRESIAYWNGEGGIMLSQTIKQKSVCFIPHVNVSYVYRYDTPTDIVTVKNRGDADLNNVQNYEIKNLNTNYLKVGGGVDVLNKESFRAFVEANGFIEGQLKSSFDVRAGFNFYF